MLKNGSHRIEITRRRNHTVSGSAIMFSDTAMALNYLRGFMGDDFSMRTFRQVLAETSLSSNLAQLNDQDVVRQLAWFLATGHLNLIVRPYEFRYIPHARGAAQDEGEGAAASRPSTQTPRTTLTWITLRVINDVTHTPIPGVRLLVRLPNGTVGEYQTGEDGLAEITGITPGICAVTSPIQGASIRDTYAFVALGESPVAEPPSEAPPETASEEPSKEAPEESAEAGSAEEQNPVRTRIARIEQHKVKTGESIKSIAEANGLTWQELAYFNWGTTVPDEINEHLRDEVGCTKKTPDGYNYSFDDADEPGILYIPKAWEEAGLATAQIHMIRVKEGAGFRIILENEYGLRIPAAEYEVTLADGSKRRGRLGKRGIAVIESPPRGTVEVDFLDYDDIEAKSLAACARKAFDDRDPQQLFRVLKHSGTMIRQTVAAYDEHFNDYTGKGLLADLDQELTDREARRVGAFLLGLADLALPSSAGKNGSVP